MGSDAMDPANMPAKFEMLSFIHSWDNMCTGTQTWSIQKVCSTAQKWLQQLQCFNSPPAHNVSANGPYLLLQVQNLKMFGVTFLQTWLSC